MKFGKTLQLKSKTYPEYIPMNTEQFKNIKELAMCKICSGIVGSIIPGKKCFVTVTLFNIFSPQIKQNYITTKRN